MSRALRRAVVKHLKDDSTLTALVPKAQIHPSTIGANPAFPLVFWEAPSSVPVGRGCTAGEEVSFFVQVYTRDYGAVTTGPNQHGPTQTAEEFCERIVEIVKARIHFHRLPLEGGAEARLRVSSVRSVRDGDEPSQWHASVTVSARVYTS